MTARIGKLARGARSLSAGGLRVGASIMQPRHLGGGAFKAASFSDPDLARWQPFGGSPDGDLLPELATMRSRSRDLARNHGIAGGALQTQLDNVLGCGLWISPKPNYVRLGKDIEWASQWAANVKALWRDWSETPWCDAGDKLTLDRLAMQFFSGAWLNGDALALPLWLPSTYSAASTRMQMIETDRLSNPSFAPDSMTLRGGIEINEYGAALAYNIRRAHPGEPFFVQNADSFTWVRIPAKTDWGRKRVIHAALPQTRPGQSRGIPELASVMKQFKVLQDYQNAELKGAVVNAMVGLVVESAMSQDGLQELLSTHPDALKMYIDGLGGRHRSAIDFSGGGMILPVPLGDKVSGFTPARPTAAYEPFTTTAFRHIASGLNMPYELLLKDFSKSNYSSARAALLEAWRFFTGRREWLAFSFYQPAYELFLEEMIDAGEIEAPNFYEKKASWCRARWIGPGRGWIDPLKEAQAAELRMDTLISSLEDECAEQGKDYEELLEQIAQEDKLLKKLGIQRNRVPKTLQPKGATDEGVLTAEDPPGGSPGAQPAR